MSYHLHHGARLTPAEAAHLLVRAATGEALSHVPVRTPGGYELRHVCTLTPEQARDVYVRTADVAAALAPPHRA